MARIVQSIPTPDNQVIASVVFNTHRDDPSIWPPYREEPIACGPILAAWLSEQFKLASVCEPGDIGIKKSGWVNVLDGNMLHQGKGRDYPLNRECVRRADEVMRNATTWDSREPLWAYLSISGGIPGFKEALTTCGQYRFEGRVFVYQEPQYGEAPELDTPDHVPPTTIESFRSRINTQNLILHGDFHGAYAAVKHLENDPHEKKWILPLKQAADYMTGTLNEEQETLLRGA